MRVWVLAVLTAVACGDRRGVRDVNGDRHIVVSCLGDSNTETHWPRPGTRRWCELASERAPEWVFTNHAVGGTTMTQPATPSSWAMPQLERALAEDQPDAARRWMAAYLRGTRAYLDAVTSGTDRDGINAILAKHTAVKDLALLAKIAPTGFDPNGRMEIKSLEADQDWFLKLGLQQGRADLGKVIDYQYVDAAVARLGKR